jgi:hypothetical protein
VVSVTPRPRFTPWERTPGTHWIGGWVSFRDGLDTEAREKILCLCRGSNPSCPVCSRTLYWLSYPTIETERALADTEHSICKGCRLQDRNVLWIINWEKEFQNISVAFTWNGSWKRRPPTLQRVPGPGLKAGASKICSRNKHYTTTLRNITRKTYCLWNKIVPISETTFLSYTHQHEQRGHRMQNRGPSPLAIRDTTQG